MSSAEERLAQLRAARDTARAEFLTRADRVRNLAKPGELRRRVMADVQIQSRRALSQAMEIAADERGVLAGTLTAVALWLARKQIVAKAMQWAPKARPALDSLRGKASGWLAHWRAKLKR